MKQGLLVIIPLIIIILAGISIYINRSKHQLELRIINLTQSDKAIQISVNDYELPYPILSGTGSEYFHLLRRDTNADLKISYNNDLELIFTDIELIRDSLNTIFLYTDEETINYFQATTPITLNKNRTALRVFSLVDYEELEITVIKEDFTLVQLPEYLNIGDYNSLSEGFYNLSIRFPEEETLYRIFLENGELYTLTIMPGYNNLSPNIRLFVDNRPGDQFIIPARLTTL